MIKNNIFRRRNDVLKILLVIFISIFISLNISNVTLGAASFGIQISVCAPEWYCTAWSNGACGTRTCTDINSCGINDNKPLEYLAVCPIVNSGGGGGSSHKTNNTVIIVNSTQNTSQQTNNLFDGYFALSSDIIKINLLPDQIREQTININSSINAQYSVEMIYPVDYSQTKNLIIPVLKEDYVSKGIQKAINIIVDSTNIKPGVYITKLVIKNQYYSRSIPIIITVDTKYVDNTNFKLDIDSNYKTKDKDNILKATLTLDTPITGNNLITNYSIVDMDGNYLLSLDKLIENTFDKSVSTYIELPNNLSEGYYILLASVSNGENITTRDAVFTLLSERYTQIEKPTVVNDSRIDGFTILLGLLFILIVSIIAIFGHYKENKRMFEQTQDLEKPTQKLQKIEEKKGIDGKNSHENDLFIDKRSELLKQSYEQGFIRKEEYERFIGIKKEIINLSTEDYHILENLKKDEGNIKVIDESENVVADSELYTRKVVENEAFILADGQKIYSIKELADSLLTMDDDTYNHHTAYGRNDFANWIAGVFKSEELADYVSRAESREQLKKILIDYDYLLSK